MDDYIGLTIPRSWAQLHHVANAMMTGIHDVFPPDNDDNKNDISLKKKCKKWGAWAVIKNILGFYFDGNPEEHTIWLTDDCRTAIL